MSELLRASLVIARRDYVATVWSKAFLLFLVGPLFPLAFGLLFGAIGSDADRIATHPRVTVAASPVDARAIAAAHARIADRIGPDALPALRFVTARGDPARQAQALLRDDRGDATAVLSGTLDTPRLAGPRGGVDRVRGDVGLLLDEARTARAIGAARPAPVVLVIDAGGASAGSVSNARVFTARIGQLLLIMLTMILAGMLLSNLIEEKSNKVIEVLAAAVPVDAIFAGKLVAMLGMSLTGILVWGTAAAVGLAAFLPVGSAPPMPAVGWPGFALLGVAYFTASYLLLGALFLGIGAQASSVREVQTLSMPITMGQLMVFALASTAVGDHERPLAIAAAIFPWSSPIAMLARGAQDAAIWPHLLAIIWQAMWIAIIIRIAAARFRTSVLKSGPGETRRWWRRKANA